MKSALRWWLLAAALLWSLASGVVVFGYHFDQRVGGTHISPNIGIFTSYPSALTLYQQDPATFLTAAIVVALALGVSLVEALLGHRESPEARGWLTGGAGGVLVFYGLFGLLWGVLSLGIIGILLVAAGFVAHSAPTS